MLQTLVEQGLNVDEAHAYENFLGRSLSTVRNMLRDEHRLELDDDALQAMRDRLFAVFRQELQPTRHIEETLTNLHGVTAVCVASSSQPERIRHSLDVTGLDRHFGERVYSATQVANGKTAPDLFLLASRQCGVAPEHCLVIEDSPTGIAAATAAGVRVFAYTGGSHVQTANLLPGVLAAAPDAQFNDMRDLPVMLAGDLGKTGLGKIGNADPDQIAYFVAVDVGTASVRVDIALGLRHILEALNRSGYGIDSLNVSGGHTKMHC